MRGGVSWEICNFLAPEVDFVLPAEVNLGLNCYSWIGAGCAIHVHSRLTFN